MEMSIFCLGAAWFPVGFFRLFLWAFWVSAGLQDSGLFGVTVWVPWAQAGLEDWALERQEGELFDGASQRIQLTLAARTATAGSAELLWMVQPDSKALVNFRPSQSSGFSASELKALRILISRDLTSPEVILWHKGTVRTQKVNECSQVSFVKDWLNPVFVSFPVPPNITVPSLFPHYWCLC